MISYSVTPNSSFSWTEAAPPPGRRFGERRDGRGEKRRQCSIGPVKRLLALLAGGLGLRAILARRQARHPAPTHAADLRAKLAESRAADAAVPEEETPAPGEQDVDTRRADVHARARQAIDDLT
jgi:hypothetical protein